MRKILLVALALSLSAPLAAQSIQDIFGINPGDVIREAQRQQAEYEERLARERARKARGARLKEFVGAVTAPRQDARCVLPAVAGRLGLAVPPGEPPAIYTASRTILEDYQAYYYSEDGAGEAPRAVATRYFPVNNVIFIDDAARSYGPGRSIDDAIAGQLALYLQYQARGLSPASPEAQAAAAGVERWFHAAYTARGVSACR